MASQYYLGFDLSTQALKVYVADENLALETEVVVKYAEDLPHYGPSDTILRKGNSVTSPVSMWIEALDVAVEKLSQIIDLSLVVAISGCAQQHGTVYTGNGFQEKLQGCDSALRLTTQLTGCFTRHDSPIWMDDSTAEYCSKLENVVGVEELCAKTGSRAHPRFSVHHIHKMVNENLSRYEVTERVMLISNFLGTLLTGEYMSIDYSDGSGMNLLDIFEKRWIKEIAELYKEDVTCKLGDPKPTLQDEEEEAETISDYFIERHSFSSECKVFRCTGDNPATLVGLCCREQDLILSLGTSDVLIGVSRSVKPSPDIHVFCNPIDNKSHMFIICYKNGSLVREELCEKHCRGDWSRYNQSLTQPPDTEDLFVGNYLLLPEIIPVGLKGAFCTSDPDFSLWTHPPDRIIRTVTEGQFLSKRNHIAAAGYEPSPDARLIVVGGASVNNTLLQLISNVFGMKVYRVGSANAAARGAALLAYAGIHGVDKMREVGYKDGFEVVAVPDPAAHDTYCIMRKLYTETQEKYVHHLVKVEEERIAMEEFRNRAFPVRRQYRSNSTASTSSARSKK